MKPWPHGIPHPERAGFPRQDQERRLKGILGVMVIAEYAPANAQDHRPVSLNQRREGQVVDLIGSSRKSIQELAIGQAGHGPRIKSDLDVPKHLAHFADHHDLNSYVCVSVPGSNVTSSHECSQFPHEIPPLSIGGRLLIIDRWV